MYRLLLLLLSFSFLSNLTFGQVVKQNNENIKSNIKKVNETQSVNDEINFKNVSGNSIITITDEGNNIGSITLPSLSSIGTSTNKLYNMSGILYFNGNALGSSSVSSLNDLTDAKYIGYSLYLGNGSGANDDGTNNDNTAVGISVLNLNTSGGANTAIGYKALYSNTTANYNTATGTLSLYNNSTGNGCTATGGESLFNNNGSENTADGNSVLFENTIGIGNTGTGAYALYNNKSGSNGVAVGYQSQFYANDTETPFTNYNTSVGYQSLMGSNTPANNTGNFNSAFGYQTLFSNDAGFRNTANGYQVLYSNTTGDRNTASGYNALYSNIDGNYNTADGYGALNLNTNGSYITAIGYLANVTADGLTNATAIGANAQVNASNKIRLGDNNVTVIEGNVDFTFPSDSTKKENFIKVDGDKVLQKFRKFRLTSWNYKRQNPITQRHYGIMAQDFFSAFGHDSMGTIGNDTTLTGSDVNGINMIAIQALEKRTAEQALTIRELENQNADLEKRLSKLEGLFDERKFSQISN